MTYGGRVFIGGISSDVSKDDIGNEFSKFGKLRTVWVASKPPGFAFVEYDDNRDAEEAVKSLNGVSLFNENKIRVEISKKRPGPPGSRYSGPIVRGGSGSSGGGPIRGSNPSFRTGNSSSLFKPTSTKPRFLNSSSSMSSSRGAPRMLDQGQRYSRGSEDRISGGGAPRFGDNTSPRYSSQNSRFPSSRPNGAGASRFGGQFNSSSGYKGSNFRSSRPMD